MRAQKVSTRCLDMSASADKTCSRCVAWTLANIYRLTLKGHAWHVWSAWRWRDMHDKYYMRTGAYILGSAGLCSMAPIPSAQWVPLSVGQGAMQACSANAVFEGWDTCKQVARALARHDAGKTCSANAANCMYESMCKHEALTLRWQNM